jgi:Na+/H+ antiporter NhaD/arsenite permease-like protein
MLSKIRKLDPVLVISGILAVISSVLVHPDAKYIDYIDVRTLVILWSLMIIVQGLTVNGVFERIARHMMRRINRVSGMVVVLVLLCFLGSMLITNDVALITFVPFSILILEKSNRENLALPVIVLQTLAANLGSMLTPIGNPQNLYLYGIMKISPLVFLRIMLPYTLLSLVLLMISVTCLPGKGEHIALHRTESEKIHHGRRIEIISYSLMFVLALCAVGRLIPYYLVAAIILIATVALNPKLIKQVDYSLLVTFVFLFIFTGNMARVEIIKETLQNLIDGREFAVSIVTSQFISNVPATLLLTSFTGNLKEVLLGVNIGGLGTLIASMASLISYKEFSRKYEDKKVRYLGVFTIMNVVFLMILILLKILIA